MAEWVIKPTVQSVLSAFEPIFVWETMLTAFNSVGLPRISTGASGSLNFNFASTGVFNVIGIRDNHF